MNSEVPRSTEPRKFNVPALVGCMAIAALLLILAMLWRNLSSTNARITTLAEENSRLRTELSDTRKELDFFKTGDSRATVKRKAATAKAVSIKPVADPETLFLQNPTVSQTDSGLIARFGFEPDVDVPLPDVVTLVIRVPSSSEAAIKSLKPVNASSYSSVDVVVNAKGNLGMIEGSPSDLSALEFELTVSAPVKATVRGSKGIKPFEMDISSGGCAIRKL